MESRTRKEPVIIYAESTPNPAALKFVANRMLLHNSPPLEFLNATEAGISPLASELFKFPFVKSVYIAANYITLFKADAIDWNDITLELREYLRNYLSAGKAVMTEQGSRRDAGKGAAIGTPPSRLPAEAIDHSTEIEKKIIAVLEQYVMPAVEQDGGMIVFRSFNEGVVSLLMRGACSGCPSSTVTLKSGIETLLKKFIPEVKEVVSEA